MRSGKQVEQTMLEADMISGNQLKKTKPFWYLFFGTFASHLGTNISILVFPTYAILHLHASDQAVAAISIAQTLPMVMFSLWVGSRSDRLDRVRLIMGADLFSASLSFICAYWLFQNSLPLFFLYIAVFFLAFLSIFYNVATQALVPDLLLRKQLLWGNSWLYAGRSIATVFGQFIASKLTAVAFGAYAMVLDGFSHVIRAIALIPILNQKAGEVTPKPQGWIQDTIDAASYIRGKKELIRIIGSVATYNFGGAFILAFFFLYAYGMLELTAFHIGISLGVGSISAAFGAIMASKWKSSINIVKRGQFFFALSCLALWLLLVASLVHPFVILLLYEIIFKFSSAVFNIAMTTRRHQIVTPDFQGRIASVGVLTSNVAMLIAAVFATFSAGILTPIQGVALGCTFSLMTFLWFIGWNKAGHAQDTQSLLSHKKSVSGAYRR